jgi:hypothetical protein
LTRAFLFYLLHSLKNRVVVRLRRLRQPKYFISALAGLGYLYFVFARQFFTSGRVRTPPPLGPDLNLLPVLETGFAFLLLILIVTPWILPSGPRALFFTEAEIQFLFPAPVSRKALLRFRIAKGQPGILFGVLVSAIIFGRGRLAPSTAFLVVTLWVVYSFLALYRMGTALAKTSLAEHGVSGLKRQIWALGLLAGIVILVSVWLKWFVPPPPLPARMSPTALLEWFSGIAGAGPAYYFLLPFRTLVRPALAPDPASFVLRLIPALVLLSLVYFWILYSHASFEEAALERAEKVAQRLEEVRRGTVRLTSKKVRRAPFRLEPRGAPHVALFWKNLISAGRINSPRALLIFTAAGVGMAVAVGAAKEGIEIAGMIVGSMAAGGAIFLVFLGPVIVRDDLRIDLLHMDLIKTWPVPGWSVVLGEVLAPAAILTAIQWGLVLVAAITLPSMGDGIWTPFVRVVFGLGAAILFPCFSLVALLIQNAAALIMPGWMQLGKYHQRGIEAMGQRLITMVATAVALFVAVVPAAIVFAATFFSGYWIFGLAIIPVAALFAAAGMLFETALAVLWLGRLFDGLDISLELYDTAQPG